MAARTKMASCDKYNFTVFELRSALRESHLRTSGSKNELIQRLTRKDPKAWDRLNERRKIAVRTSERASEKTSETASVVAEEDYKINEEPEVIMNIPPLEQRNEVVQMRTVDDDMTRELILLRKERDLWQRERRILQRELELARAPLMTSSTGCNAVSMIGIVQSIKKLLPEYDATDDTFWKWKYQLEILRNLYQLDDNSAKVLISVRLKGSALSWFHSKPEYLMLTIDELLKEMEQTFDLCPSKLRR